MVEVEVDSQKEEQVVVVDLCMVVEVEEEVRMESVTLSVVGEEEGVQLRMLHVLDSLTSS